MIYVMSQKFLRTYIEQMVVYREYFIIDADNYSVTGAGSGRKMAVSNIFNKSHPVGTMCPNVRLYDSLIKIFDGEKVNKHRLEKDIRNFITDREYIAGVVTVLRTLIQDGPEEPVNIFIALPNVVYIYLHEEIMRSIQLLSRTKTEIVRDMKPLLGNMKQLSDTIPVEAYNSIKEEIALLDKEYELESEFSDYTGGY